MNEKKKQHTVPKFYLRQFTPKTGQRVLWQYSKSSPLKPVTKSPEIAATENYFYSFPRPDGSWDHSLEDDLAKAEDAATPVVAHLIREGSLSKAQRGTLATFMAAQVYRSTAIRYFANAQKDKAKTVDATIGFIERNRDSLLSDCSDHELEQYAKDVEARGYGMELDEKFCLAHLFSRTWKLAQRYASMSWTICRASEPYFFVTSDNPVYARRPDRVKSPEIVGIDRDDFKVELSFPLSPECYLLAKWGSRTDVIARDYCTKSRIKELNRRTVLCAHEHVFCREQSSLIQSLVRQHQAFRLQFPVFDL